MDSWIGIIVAVIAFALFFMVKPFNVKGEPSIAKHGGGKLCTGDTCSI